MSREPVRVRQVVLLLAAWAAGQRLSEPRLAFAPVPLLLASRLLLVLSGLPVLLMPLVPSRGALAPGALPMALLRPASRGMEPLAGCTLESQTAHERHVLQSNPREQMARIPHRSNCQCRR